jgi:hypothetical protein
VKQKLGRELLEICRDRQDDVLGFTTDTRIWPRTTSQNAASAPEDPAEMSGRLASDDVTQDRLDITSYIDTARKHGRKIIVMLHQLLLGNPWRPPDQAFPVTPVRGSRADNGGYMCGQRPRARLRAVTVGDGARQYAIMGGYVKPGQSPVRPSLVAGFARSRGQRAQR